MSHPVASTSKGTLTLRKFSMQLDTECYISGLFKAVMPSILVVYHSTKKRHIILTYLKAFFVRHSSEYENVG